ncbi:MAG: tetratricopeptide repeat protein [Gammaproteobacteria bacterium]
MTHKISIVLLLMLIPLAALATSIDDARRQMSQGDLNAAESSVRTVIKAQPSNVEARLLLGVIQAQAGQLDESIRVFQSLIEDRPELPQAYNNLAAIYASRGEFEQARGTLLRAIEGNPAYPVARENLGDLYANMAQIEYQRALNLQSDNERLRQKAEKMSSITGRAIKQAPTKSRELPARIDNKAEQPMARSANTSVSETSQACLLIGPYGKRANNKPLKAWLIQQGAELGESNRPTPQERTMVYLEASADASERKQLMARLGKQGIKDMSAFKRESGQWVISLGVFGLKTSVVRRLDELIRKGFDPKSEKSVKMVNRDWLKASFSEAAPAIRDVEKEVKTPGVSIAPCQ